MNAAQFKFTPFSAKQLQVLNWWMAPEAYSAQADELANHPEWLNRSDYDTIVCDGSIRAGKTLTMSMSYILWAMTNYSDEQFGIAGKTIGSLRRNVITPLKRMLTGRGYKVTDRRADNLLVVVHGSITNYFYLFGGKDEGSQDLVQGLTAAGFFFDEVALMPESFVNQATGRVSLDGGKWWFNCNPAGPYHWFKQEWIDQPEKHRVKHIHFTMHDNPSLSQAVIERYERSFSGVFYDRFIRGLWVMADGVIYDNFDEDKMVEEPPDTIASKYIVSCDYGTLNPTVFLLWGLFGSTWYCIKEYYYDGRHNALGATGQKTDVEYANDLQKFLGNIQCRIIVDPSAASFITLLRQRGMQVTKANNDVVDGIRLVQSVMNSGQIKYAPGLTNLFKEKSSYAWDSKAAEHGEDKPIKEHDHAMDAERYFVKFTFRPQARVQTFKLM